MENAPDLGTRSTGQTRTFFESMSVLSTATVSKLSLGLSPGHEHDSKRFVEVLTEIRIGKASVDVDQDQWKSSPLSMAV